MAQNTYVQSGSRVDGSYSPVNIMQVGDPSQPTDLIIKNGRILAYDPDGQVTIQDGIVQAAGIAARIITAEKITTTQRPYIHSIPFNPISRNQVTWAAGGKIYFAAGDEVTIQAGGTGALSQPVYIYYVSGTELRMTSSIAVATAGNSVPILKVIPQDGTDETALIQDFRGLSTTISGDQITTGKINANRIWVGMTSFLTNISFTAINADQVEWTSGTLETSGGKSYDINDGQTSALAKSTGAFSSDANTVGLWHFDETMGTTVDNAEGTAGLDGSATGTTITADGRFDSARYFDGDGDYVQVNDSSALDLITFTLEASFRTDADADGNEHVIVGRENTISSSWPYRILINGDGFVQFDIRPNINLAYVLTSQVALNDNVWHDIRATFDAATDTMELWIDNIKHSSRLYCTTDPQASAEPLLMGGSNAAGGSKYFEGYIDEVRLSSNIRTGVTPAKRYIYWDGTPTLAITTNYANAVGTSKILMAIMTPKRDYGSAELQVFGNDGTIIDGNKIQTGRIQSTDGKTYFDLNERRINMNDDAGDDRLILGYHPTRFLT